MCRLINGSEHTTPNKSDERRIKEGKEFSLEIFFDEIL